MFSKAPEPLPHNVEVEQGLLGILFVDPQKVDDAADALVAEDFFLPAHQKIFTAICSVSAKGKVASPLTLKNYFDNEEDLESVGGGKYLVDLAASIISVINLPSYIETLLDLSMRRKLIITSQDMEIKSREFDIEHCASDILEQTEETLFEIAGDADGDSNSASLNNILSSTVSLINDVQSGRVTGINSGLHSLDMKTNGFWAGNLVFLAGRPAMGKTALGLTICHNVAQQGKNVLFFSLEMGGEEIGQRLLARYTELPTQMQLKKGSFKNEHFGRIVNAQKEMSGLSLTIDPTPGVTVHQIRSRARRHKRKHGLDFVLIDYLGLIEVSSRYINKVDQIGEITRALKIMAKDLEVPVIVLHQLNREVEKREDKRPMLADLRDSGNIEQDADAVLFVYREEYYLQNNPPKRKSSESDEAYSKKNNDYFDHAERVKGCAEIIIAKIRQGQTGFAKVKFNGTRQLFYDADVPEMEGV